MLDDCNSKGNDRRVECAVLFLNVLLDAPDGRATLTEATPAEFRSKPFPDGGKWRGGIPQWLARLGVIGASGVADGRLESHRSSRTARRSGVALVWKLIDREAARRWLAALTKQLGQSHPRQKTLFDDLDDSTE